MMLLTSAMSALFDASSPAMLSAFTRSTGSASHWDDATLTLTLTLPGSVTHSVRAPPGTTGAAAECAASAALLRMLAGVTPVEAPRAEALQGDIIAHARVAAQTLHFAGAPSLCSTPGALMLPAALTWAAELTNARAKRAVGLARDHTIEGADGDLSRQVRLRYATAADAATLERFVRELAEFEREPEAVRVGAREYVADGLSEEGLRGPGALTDLPPMFHALIAEVPASAAGGVIRGEAGGDEPAMVAVAMAICHSSYSTWEGRCIYLEDLYVSPAFRRRGVASTLFAALASAALAAGCARLQWSCLTWNQSAVAAYDKMGAHRLGDWVLYRLYEEDLRRVSERR